MTTQNTRLAAAKGDHHIQLKHLKLHLAFQSQTKHNLMKLNWNTTITRDQSRRHITAHLHSKINAKTQTEAPPNAQSVGKTDTPEGQLHLQQFARRIKNKERISPGDGYLLNWDLRYRAIRSKYPQLTQQQFQDTIADDQPAAIRPKQDHFPQHILQAHAHTRKLKQLLTAQGISPKRHRSYIIVEAFSCPGCHHNTLPDQTWNPKCEVCARPLTLDNITQTASKSDDQSQINPQPLKGPTT